MNKIINYLKKKKYATMKELRDQGFQTRDIKALKEQGKIDKIKSGLYKYSDVSYANEGFVDVCKSVPKGVICLISAMDYHYLSAINPDKIHIAIPHSEKEIDIAYPPVKFYYFRDSFFELGIQEIQTEMGSFKIYNAEKTICDMFRYRNKLGEDIALEGLKNYLKRKDANINKLWEYAIKCRVKTIVQPYIKAMVAQ
jgi:predicted transcriptional regulator of viral defense system